MNTRRAAFLQAIRGPVLLITLGILFAIHQAGILSFSRTWPLLIIVIGVMKLLERSSDPAPALQSGYPGRGDYRSHSSYPNAAYAPSQQPPQPPQPQDSPQPPGGDVK
jgi:hypothetical protein